MEKKRIALTVPAEVHEVLNRLAELKDCTVTAVISEILVTSKPHLFQAADVLEKLRAQQNDLAIESIKKLVSTLGSDSAQMQMHMGALNYQIKEGKKDATKKK